MFVCFYVFSVATEDFSSVFTHRWVILAHCEGRNIGQSGAETEKPQPVSFPLQRFRDGRDYGRITLHNMAAPNQIKAKTIKARVKATAVSSFKCLPPPPQPEQECCPQRNCFHPQSFHFWGRHKPLLHEYWTVSRPDINPSKQCKQSSK